MSDANSIYPPVQYPAIALIIAVIIVLAIGAWWAMIFWLTRERRVATLSTLAPQKPIKPDLTQLKAKYLKLIDEVEAQVHDRRWTIRYGHQRLSLLLRYFAFEASGFRAQVMTLADLKMSRYQELTSAIDLYYEPEFDTVMRGTIDSALEKARQVVSSWR